MKFLNLLLVLRLDLVSKINDDYDDDYHVVDDGTSLCMFLSLNQSRMFLLLLILIDDGGGGGGGNGNGILGLLMLSWLIFLLIVFGYLVFSPFFYLRHQFF